MRLPDQSSRHVTGKFLQRVNRFGHILEMQAADRLLKRLIPRFEATTEIRGLPRSTRHELLELARESADALEWEDRSWQRECVRKIILSTGRLVQFNDPNLATRLQARLLGIPQRTLLELKRGTHHANHPR